MSRRPKFAFAAALRRLSKLTLADFYGDIHPEAIARSCCFLAGCAEDWPKLLPYVEDRARQADAQIWAMRQRFAQLEAA